MPFGGFGGVPNVIANRAMAIRGGNYPADPWYTGQQAKIRSDAGPRLARLKRALTARGYSPDIVQQKMNPAYGQLGQQNLEIMGQESERQRAMREERRRNNPLRQIGGFVLGALPQFAAMKYQSVLDQNNAFGGSRRSWVSRSSNNNAWGG
jgi:hypothetical protein